MSHTIEQLDRMFGNAARYGISQWNRPFCELEDLKHGLWERYLESPATQKKLQELKAHQVTNLAKRMAVQILVKEQSGKDEWDGKNHYDTDNVKQALKGEGYNPYLAEILPEAFKSLEEQNASYAAEIRSRYELGVVPPQGKHVKLVRALKSLTEHVNRIAITADLANDSDGNIKDGPGSRRVMQKKRPKYKHEEHPELIKAKGVHSDPTANIALMLMKNPELKDEYLSETPLRKFLEGKGA